MPTKPGFYGVRVGKVPGVYETWDECLEQVKGVSRARFKRFERASDAFDFVNRPPSPPPLKSHSTSPSLSVPTQHTGVRFPAGQPAQGCLVNDTISIRDYPDNVRSDRIFNTPTSNLENSEKVVNSEVLEQDQEITNKRRLEQTESHEPLILESVDKETMTVRPTKRSRRHKTKQHPSSTNSSNNHNIDTNRTALRDFFSVANYKNPTALLKLDAVSFGAHELWTMRGLQEGTIARRFRQLIGGGASGSTAQVESLAFAVANVTEDAWNSLERYI